MKKISCHLRSDPRVGAACFWRAVAEPSRFGTFTGAPEDGGRRSYRAAKRVPGKTVAIEGEDPAAMPGDGLLLLFPFPERTRCAWTCRTSQ